MTPARLYLDFRKRRRISPTGIAALALGASLLGAVAFMHRHADAKVSRLEEMLAELSPTQRGSVVTERLPVASTEHMRTVLARLNLPWERFFAALETIAADDVTLLAISPNTARGTVQFRGEARDLYAALRYVQALGTGGYFRDVELIEHEIGTQNPTLPVRFVIAAHWDGIGEAE